MRSSRRRVAPSPDLRMPQNGCQRGGVPDQNVDDALDIIERGHWNPRCGEWRIRGNSDDCRVAGMKQRLTDRGTVYLELGMRLAFVAFDQHEIDRAKLLEQNTQRRLGFSAQLMHERPALGRTNQNFGGADHAVGMGILARLVDVEAVVGVLERRDRESPRDDAGDDFGEERGLARAAPAGEADDAHAALYSSPKRAPRGTYWLSFVEHSAPRTETAHPRKRECTAKDWVRLPRGRAEREETKEQLRHRRAGWLRLRAQMKAPG